MDMYDYGSSYEHTDYYTAEEALCVVKEIILRSFKKRGKEGYDEWMMFGEDAYIAPINGAPAIQKFNSQQFVKSICGLPIYDFTDLDDEKIKHPDFPNYQPTDGDLVVIRFMTRKNKMNRLRSLLDPELDNLEFMNVEGVAVSHIRDGRSTNLAGYGSEWWNLKGCLAWDHKGGREFRITSAHRNGGYISYEEFQKIFEDGLIEQTQKSWLKD